VIRRYHALVADVVRSHGGYVAQYLGDGALIYFGYPTAGEDDAERAVRTELALAEQVRNLKDREGLQVRSGVATGLVVVGDRAEGSQASHEPRIMGETPNLAAPRACSRGLVHRLVVGGGFYKPAGADTGLNTQTWPSPDVFAGRRAQSKSNRSALRRPVWTAGSFLGFSNRAFKEIDRRLGELEASAKDRQQPWPPPAMLSSRARKSLVKSVRVRCISRTFQVVAGSSQLCDLMPLSA
jgi:hypothetical protein